MHRKKMQEIRSENFFHRISYDNSPPNLDAGLIKIKLIYCIVTLELLKLISALELHSVEKKIRS